MPVKAYHSHSMDVNKKIPKKEINAYFNKKRKNKMIDEFKLNAIQLQTKRWIDRLDQMALAKEAVWGIGRLEKLVSPEMQKKWRAQNDKLSDALQSKNLNAVAQIVEGTIRGWDALEAEAIKLGHKPNDNECWEATHKDGEFIYRIFKTKTESYAQQPEEGYVHYSLEELSRILDNYQLVNQVKHVVGGSVVSIERDKTKKYTIDDDQMPW